MNTHGNNDIKYGTSAYSPSLRRLRSDGEPRVFGSQGDDVMLTLSLFVRLEAKPGKENEVAAFLKQALELRLGPSTFAVFDAFRDEQGRQNHLNGPIAQALMTQAPNLLASPPVIERVEVLGAKVAA
jgi:quinol monooxygenase YgiN